MKFRHFIPLVFLALPLEAAAQTNESLASFRALHENEDLVCAVMWQHSVTNFGADLGDASSEEPEATAIRTLLDVSIRKRNAYLDNVAEIRNGYSHSYRFARRELMIEVYELYPRFLEVMTAHAGDLSMFFDLCEGSVEDEAG